jgi:hypothetical protein
MERSLPLLVLSIVTIIFMQWSENNENRDVMNIIDWLMAEKKLNI